MDYVAGIAIALGSLSIGVAGALLGVKKGVISKDYCSKCRLSIENEFRSRDDYIRDISSNLKKLHDKHDSLVKMLSETNAELKEVIGFLRGAGKNI